MNRSTGSLVAIAAAIGVGLGSYGIATAASGSPVQNQVDDDGPNEDNDSDAPLTGSDLDRAVAAALDHVGGGEVTETETGDDGAAYGVEIRLDDGSQVEVNLDADFEVIGSEPDDD
jgi:uncharacterized membrane protein YkoI